MVTVVWPGVAHHIVVRARQTAATDMGRSFTGPLSIAFGLSLLTFLQKHLDAVLVFGAVHIALIVGVGTGDGNGGGDDGDIVAWFWFWRVGEGGGARRGSRRRHPNAPCCRR